jgi:bifunctional pyridoxal-dependent enzyme with beta-cystathionase and maltose regulon repressor activities
MITVAFDEGERWLDGLLVVLRANRGRLHRLLAEHLPAVTWRPEDVQATHLAWLDCSALGLDDPAGIFERRGRVAPVESVRGPFLPQCYVAFVEAPGASRAARRDAGPS